jgi:hypothetical protein
LRKDRETNGKRAGQPTLFLLFFLPAGLADFMALTLLLFHLGVNRILSGLCPGQSDRTIRVLKPGSSGAKVALREGQKSPRPNKGAAS